MKLSPDMFDWQKYDYHLEWVGNLRDGVEALDHSPPTTWTGENYAGDSLNLIRVAKPEPLYQLLTPGMEIREGDEQSLRTDTVPQIDWATVPGFEVGTRVAGRSVLYRRKLPEGTKLP